MDKVYIPAEVKARDFLPKVLLSKKLAQLGFCVYFGERWRMERFAMRSEPGVLLERAIPPVDGYFERLQTLKERGFKLAVHDVEAGSVFDVPDAYRYLRIDRNIVPLIDQFFPWSYSEKRILIDEFQVDPRRIAVTGNLLFDLSGRFAEGLFRDDVTRLQESYGKFVLVNLAWRLFDRMSQEQRVKQDSRLEEGMRKNGATEITIRAWREKKEKKRNNNKSLVSDIAQLAKALPGKKFVIRPHPSENFDAFERAMRFPKNVEVVMDGAALLWIKAADQIITCNCTTSLECLSAGKVAINHDTLGELSDDAFHKKTSIASRAVDDLSCYLKKDQSCGVKEEKVKEAKSDLGGFLEYNSAEKMACLISGMAKGALGSPLPYHEGWLHSKLRELARRARGRGQNRKWASTHEIEEVLASLSSMETRGIGIPSVKVTEVEHDIFKIIVV